MKERKTVEVACSDLELLLDFCENATFKTPSGKHVSIDAIDLYRDAHRELNRAYLACIKNW